MNFREVFHHRWVLVDNFRNFE